MQMNSLPAIIIPYKYRRSSAIIIVFNSIECVIYLVCTINNPDCVHYGILYVNKMQLCVWGQLLTKNSIDFFYKFFLAIKYFMLACSKSSYVLSHYST